MDWNALVSCDQGPLAIREPMYLVLDILRFRQKDGSLLD